MSRVCESGGNPGLLEYWHSAGIWVARPDIRLLWPPQRPGVLLMEPQPLVVRVFAAPLVTCGSGETWASAAAAMGERIRRRFGEGITVEFVELFSPRSFDFPAVLARVEAGASLPLVTVGDDVISEGGKLSEPRIGRALADRGVLPK